MKLILEKICLKLERMQDSEGFNKLTTKQSYTKNLKKSRILTKELLDKIKINLYRKREVNDFFIIDERNHSSFRKNNK